MTLFCIDTSAWHHATNSKVAREWTQHLERDELGICDQVRLEILWSARSQVNRCSGSLLGALCNAKIAPRLRLSLLEATRLSIKFGDRP